MRIWEWVKKMWDSVNTDPYVLIASNMRMEGYTDLEIEEYIRQAKK